MTSLDLEEADERTPPERALYDKLVTNVLKMFGVPWAALGIIHLIKLHWHVQLLPLGEDIIGNFEYFVRWISGGLYWLPFRIFHLAIPVWLKDAATISIVSVGINRRASLEGSPLAWNLKWSHFWSWFRQELEIKNIFDAIEVVPHLVSMILAQILGVVVATVFRWTWLASAVAASSFVVFRGMILLGLLYPFKHLVNYIKSAGNYSRLALEERRNARMYAVYAAAVVTAVIWFLAELGNGFSAS